MFSIAAKRWKCNESGIIHNVHNESKDRSKLIFDSPPFPKTKVFDKKLFNDIIALFITLLLTPLEQKLVDNILHNRSFKFL